jgi:hypothetical protein
VTTPRSKGGAATLHTDDPVAIALTPLDAAERSSARELVQWLRDQEAASFAELSR